MERKPFLLRLDPKLLRALEMWARDDLRSLNAQIEFLLRKALVAARRASDGDGDTARRERPPDGR